MKNSVQELTGFESANKEGKYIYEGVMDVEDLKRLLEIAKDQGLVAVSVNEYISYIIHTYYTN